METYGKETEEYKESNVKWEEKKKELDNQIELNGDMKN